MLTGKNFIGSARTDSRKTFHAFNPAAGADIAPAFFEASLADVDNALSLAAAAFDQYRRKSPKEISAFLQCISDEIERLDDDFIKRACDKTGLPAARIQGERD